MTGRPRRPAGIAEDVEYSARVDGTRVTLIARRHRIEFVEETIPDGVTAGMPGHRPVPCVAEFTFEMGPRQARALLDEFAEAVANAERAARR